MEPLQPWQAELAKGIAAFLPHEKQPGKPFYIFLETDTYGNATGNMHMIKEGKGEKRKLLLFPSREAIEKMEPFLKKHSPSLQIRGVSEKHLEALIRFSEEGKDFDLAPVRIIDSMTGNIVAQSMSGNEVRELADLIQKEGVAMMDSDEIKKVKPDPISSIVKGWFSGR
jgi:hypothetical protein